MTSIEKFKRLEIAYESRVLAKSSWKPARSKNIELTKSHLSGVVEVRYFYANPKNKWKTPKQQMPLDLHKGPSK